MPKKQGEAKSPLQREAEVLREQLAEALITIKQQDNTINDLKAALAKSKEANKLPSGPSRSTPSRGTAVAANPPKRISTATDLKKTSTAPAKVATDRYVVAGRKIPVALPTEYKEGPRTGAKPEVSYELEHVYGYRATYPGHNVRNDPVILSPTQIAYAAAGVVVLLDTAKPGQRFYSAHDDDVLALTKGAKDSKHGQVMASGEVGRKPPIRVWSADSGSTIAVLEGGVDRGVASLAFSPSGERLASCGLDNSHTVTVWDWRKKYRMAVAKGHTDTVYSIMYHPASGDELTICMAAAKAYKVFSVTEPPATVAGTDSPEGAMAKRTAAFGKSGVTASGDPQICTCLGFTLDGKAVTGCASGDVIVWNGLEVATLLRDTHTAGVHSLCRLEDGSFVTGDLSGTLGLWTASMLNTTTIKLQVKRGTDGTMEARAMSFIKDSTVIVGCSDGSLRKMDVRKSGDTTTFLVQAHGNGELWGLAAHPKLGDVFASASNDKTVRVWSAASKTLGQSRSLPFEGRSVDWHPDGTKLAVGLANGQLLLLKSAAPMETIASVQDRQVRGQGWGLASGATGAGEGSPPHAVSCACPGPTAAGATHGCPLLPRWHLYRRRLQ